MATPSKNRTGGKPRSSSSMASGKDEICSDAACIADLEGDSKSPEDPTAADVKPTKRGRKSSSSSMTFGKEKGCSDEECIGIK